MASKRNRRNRDRAFKSKAPKQRFIFEYYQLSFLRLHQELRRQTEPWNLPPPVRAKFWQLVPLGRHNPIDSQFYLLRYYAKLEEEIRSIVSKQSLTYWYHVYRRLAPGAIGEEKSSATIHHTRSILDAAFQKYGQVSLCDRIAFSTEVKLSEVFAGEPRGTELEFLKSALQQCPQLVLTNFTVTELREVFKLERLAYEVWRTAAQLRITAKGASLEVFDGPPYVADARSDEIDALVTSYDARAEKRSAAGTFETLTGTVFSNAANSEGLSLCWTVNSERLKHSWAEQWLNATGHPIRIDVPLNFLPFPINLTSYLNAHRPLSESFEQCYGFTLDECVTVFAAIGQLPMHIANSTDPFRVLRAEQRGYDGSYSMKRIRSWIDELVPVLAPRVNCRHDISQFRTSEILEWLTLKDRSQIDLLYPGPHAVFIPIQGNSPTAETEYLIDFVWTLRRLRDLFFGITVADNNFKGVALESVMQRTDMPLHQRQLFANDGTSKQIDASFAVGSKLFIVECRAWSRSIGFEKGHPKAVDQRSEKIKAMLKAVDDKAQWLCRNPRGRNYDVSRFGEIIPVGVTPFVEYIPTLFEWYWLRKGVPRVLTPDELKEELNSSAGELTYYHGYRL